MFNQQKGALGVNEILLIVVLMVAVGFVFWRISDTDEVVNETEVNNTAVSNPVINSGQPADETSQPAEDVVASADVEEITLEAVNDYVATGTATRSFGEGGFSHEVIMQTGPPAEGKFYEGWIVGPSIISTGELTEEEDGVWSLTYTSDEDLLSHSRVVITEETSANGLDGVPEDHVLEGSF